MDGTELKPFQFPLKKIQQKQENEKKNISADLKF